MPTNYLIDVFNLLHQYSATKSLMKNNQLLEAEQLFINKVLNFTNGNNCTCHLYFDGMNQELAAKWNNPKFKIIFCHPQSADDKIKAFIKNSYKNRSRKKSIITVSNDHELLNYSRRFDIKTMNIDNFLNLFENISSVKKNKYYLNEKPVNVSNADIDEYLKLLEADNKKNENSDYE